MLRSIVGGDRRALLLSVVALAPVLGVSAYASQGEGAASSPLTRNDSTQKKKEKELMTEETLGTEALVREGDEAFERYRYFIAESGPLPCMVRHPDAGGQCERPAVIEVYRLHFCEVHRAEAKAGALEELYHDAANFLKRLDTPTYQTKTLRPYTRCATPWRDFGRQRWTLRSGVKP